MTPVTTPTAFHFRVSSTRTSSSGSSPKSSSPRPRSPASRYPIFDFTSLTAKTSSISASTTSRSSDSHLSPTSPAPSTSSLSEDSEELDPRPLTPINVQSPPLEGLDQRSSIDSNNAVTPTSPSHPQLRTHPTETLTHTHAVFPIQATGVVMQFVSATSTVSPFNVDKGKEDSVKKKKHVRNGSKALVSFPNFVSPISSLTAALRPSASFGKISATRSDPLSSIDGNFYRIHQQRREAAASPLPHHEPTIDEHSPLCHLFANPSSSQYFDDPNDRPFAYDDDQIDDATGQSAVGQGWVGEWNLADMQDVISQLRMLKWGGV